MGRTVYYTMDLQGVTCPRCGRFEELESEASRWHDVQHRAEPPGRLQRSQAVDMDEESLRARTARDELGIDPDRIAVMGASAGGGLSATVAQRSHDEGIVLRAQVLVYPMIDDRAGPARRPDRPAAPGSGSAISTSSTRRASGTRKALRRRGLRAPY